MVEPVTGKLSASFRDPSGFIYTREGVLLRQINQCYEADYNLLHSSGLLERLWEEKLLVPHEEVEREDALTADAIAVIHPEFIPFISYPYEWSFGMLKAAALHTLQVQNLAIEHGMWLKDATAYNVQFCGERPLFIDTLSFEALPEGQPWIAYRQFCRHFLAPLALMSYVDPRLAGLLRVHLDGIPLELASKTLPFRSRFHSGVAMHIHMHAKSEAVSAKESVQTAPPKVSKVALLALVDSLRRTVESLKWEPTDTEWADYYANTNYSDRATAHKQELVAAFLEETEPAEKTIWDLGANTGAYSAIAADHGAFTVAWDIDPAAVEAHYRALCHKKDGRVLPLVLDLSNPSPGLGWNLEERSSFADRGPAHCLLVLALLHHLAIGNNVPLPQILRLFADIAEYAVVEFVPKTDSQVKRLLRSRKDIFDDYTQSGFEAALEPLFVTLRKEGIQDTHRTLYLLRRRG